MSSPSRKNILIFRNRKSVYIASASRPTQRGVSRTSRTRGGMRWTRRRARRARLRRTAKSCGPDTPTLVSSSRSRRAGDGGKKARSPGRARISRKAMRRESRMSPLDLYARVRFFSCNFAHETAGAARIRLSLRPLTGEGVKSKSKPRANGAARSRSHVMASFRLTVVIPGRAKHEPQVRNCTPSWSFGPSPE